MLFKYFSASHGNTRSSGMLISPVEAKKKSLFLLAHFEEKYLSEERLHEYWCQDSYLAISHFITKGFYIIFSNFNKNKRNLER